MAVLRGSLNSCVAGKDAINLDKERDGSFTLQSDTAQLPPPLSRPIKTNLALTSTSGRCISSSHLPQSPAAAALTSSSWTSPLTCVSYSCFSKAFRRSNEQGKTEMSTMRYDIILNRTDYNFRSVTLAFVLHHFSNYFPL